MNSRFSLITILLTIASGVKISWCDELCTPTTVTVGKELPKLPDQFQTHIEHNFKSSIENFTEEYDEYYDFTNDRGSVIRYRDSKKERQYFLYKTNELISITGRVE